MSEIYEETPRAADPKAVCRDGDDDRTRVYPVKPEDKVELSGQILGDAAATPPPEGRGLPNLLGSQVDYAAPEFGRDRLGLVLDVDNQGES